MALVKEQSTPRPNKANEVHSLISACKGQVCLAEVVDHVEEEMTSQI